MALFQDADVELEVLLPLLLAALEPAAESRRAALPPMVGQGGEDGVGERAHTRDLFKLQTVAGAGGNHKAFLYGGLRRVGHGGLQVVDHRSRN